MRSLGKKIREWWNTPIPLGALVCVWIMVVVAVVFLVRGSYDWRTREVGYKLRMIDSVVQKYYVGEQPEPSELADWAAVGYLMGVGDRWSSYLSAEETMQYMRQDQGRTMGIGVSVVHTEQALEVYLVHEQGPAAQAGLMRGDAIVGAQGLTCADDGTQAVLDAIGGEQGTEVELTVRHADGQTQTYTMVRDEVVQTLVWGELREDAVGYIRIEGFNEGSAAQFDQVLSRLVEQGAQALVCDVRHNGGGRVTELTAMLDKLLPEGTLMTLTSRTGESRVYQSDAACIDLPLAVLIDESSISAAEFFAAALDEYDRAALVGARTTGKGYAQKLITLYDGSAINLSVEQYYTPKGNSLADTGIAPHVPVELSEQALERFYLLTPHEDTQWQAAHAYLLDQLAA